MKTREDRWKAATSILRELVIHGFTAVELDDIFGYVKDMYHTLGVPCKFCGSTEKGHRVDYCGGHEE